MITFYLRNFAPEDFGEDREVDVKVEARVSLPRNHTGHDTPASRGRACIG